MATVNSEHNETVFDRIASEIERAFAQIIEKTKNRRDQLLTELNELRLQFQKKMKSHITELEELKQLQAQLMEISIKQNLVLKVQEASLVPIEQQINELENKSVEPLLKFECPINDVLDKMETLGAIIDESAWLKSFNLQQIDYSKINLKRSFGKQGTGNGEFQSPLRMHLNDIGQIYVVDRKNKRVQVYDAENENFLFYFGQDLFTQPSSVTSNRRYCYVTDFGQNKIYQFRIANYSLVKASKETGGSFKRLKSPAGITISDEGLIYVADGDNNRVCVFDTALKYVSEFGVGMLVFPRDVKILFNVIFILDESPLCLHTFNMAGMKLRSIISCGRDKQIDIGVSFCLDFDRNILITDINARTLKVFSPEGELLHKIGEKAPETAKIGNCAGVLLVGNLIYISCQAPLHCIKVFC